MDVKIKIENEESTMFNAVIKSEDEFYISKSDIKFETDLGKGDNQTYSLHSISPRKEHMDGDKMFESDIDNTKLKRENLSSSNEDEEAVREIKKEELILKSESDYDESTTDSLPSTSINKGPNGSHDVLKQELSTSDGDEEILSEIKTEELILKSEGDDSGPESNWKEAEVANIREMLLENGKLGKHFESGTKKRKAASSIKKYICNCCDYKTNRRANLNLHVLVRHDKNTNNKKFSCPHCDYKGYRKRDLQIHMMVKHDENTSIRIYFCNHCDYKTYNKNHFNCHVLAKHDESSMRKYKCNYCEYKTNHKGHLNMHMLTKHDESAIKKYNCNDCDYKTNLKGNFNTHVLAKHDESAIKKFICNICDYKTYHKGNLNTHVLAKHNESGVKKFNCNYCDYKTNHKGHLTSHILAKHEVSYIRKYNCDNCEYKTNHKGHFNSHTLAKHGASSIKKI